MPQANAAAAGAGTAEDGGEAQLRAYLRRILPAPSSAAAAQPDDECRLLSAMLGESPFALEGLVRKEQGLQVGSASGSATCALCAAPCAAPPQGAPTALSAYCARCVGEARTNSADQRKSISIFFSFFPNFVENV